MKKIILTAIITAIICITGTVYAVSVINAGDVTYKDSNVETALNNLYITANKDLKDYLEEPTYYENYGQDTIDRTLSQSISKGKYLLVISEGKSWTRTSEVYGASNTSANITCASNNCLLTKLSGRFIRVPSQEAQLVINNKAYLYYLEVKETTDTINILQGSSAGSGSNKPQYLNLQVIPINK